MFVTTLLLLQFILLQTADAQISEKIRAVDVQANLIERRLELLKDVEDLKSALGTNNLQTVVQLDSKIDALMSRFTDVHSKLQKSVSLTNQQLNVKQFRLIQTSNKAQMDVDEMLNYMEDQITVLEVQRVKS